MTTTNSRSILRPEATTRLVARTSLLTRCSLAGCALVATLAIGTPALAAPQNAPAAGSTEPGVNERFVVVTRDNTVLRSGPASSYYEFAVLKAGTVLRVKESRREYYGVLTEGLEFRSQKAYVHYPTDAAGWIEMQPDGKAAVVGKRMDLVAANLGADDPALDSWKRIRYLEPGLRLEVLETQQNGSFTVHTGPRPADAIGWINERVVELASPAQIAAYRQKLAGTLAKPEETIDAPEPVTPDAAQTTAGDSAETTSAETSESTTDADDGTRNTSARDSESGSGAGAGSGAEAETPAGDGTPDTAPTTESRGIENGAPVADRGPRPAKASSEPTPRERLNALEAAFRGLQKEPIETAEVQPLRALYLALANDVSEASPAVERFARTRVEQLEIWAELQERSTRIENLRKRLEVSSDAAEVARRAAETTGGYAAIGKLATSTIFEGTSLPRLLRLQDAATGRTIAYLRPDDEAFDLGSMLGQYIGVIGEKSYDTGLRLNIIRPRQIDLLTPATPTPSAG